MKKISLWLAAVALSACTGGISKSDLTGTWQHNMFEYVLNSDGTYSVDLGWDHGHGEWSLEGDSLFVGNDRFRVDSLNTITEGGRKYDALYLSYTAKKYSISAANLIFNFDGAYDSFQKRVQEGYLGTMDGYKWLVTKQGQEWLLTDDGQSWLASEEGQKYLSDLEAIEVRQAKWVKVK